MSSKPPPLRPPQSARGAAQREAELVLRDESDEIIDNLKQQLSALQAQVNRYKSQGGAGGGGGARAGDTGRGLGSGRRTLAGGDDVSIHVGHRVGFPQHFARPAEAAP